MIKTLSALALAASIIGISAQAQAGDVSTSAGDLIFAMRTVGSTGAGYDYEADLGSYTNFLPGGAYATTANFSLSNFVSIADISKTSAAGGFGSSWNSDSDNYFSIIGNHADTIFASGATTDPVYGLGSSQNPDANVINGYVLALGNGSYANGTETGASTHASYLSSSDANSFEAESTGNTDIPPYFQFDSNTDFETLANGTSTVGLWEVANNANAENNGGTDLGTFTLSSSGLTFTGAGAVPEPSTWATMIVGAVTLLGFGSRRRRSA